MAFAAPCYYSPSSYSTYSCDMDLDGPIADSFIAPPQTLPTEMDVDEETSSSSSSSSRGFRNPFSREKPGFCHSTYSDGRPKNPFAGESTRTRPRSSNNKAKTETKAQAHRGGQKQAGKAGHQKQQPEGPSKPKPKGQQHKQQQPRQPKQNRGPQRAETKEDKPVNPFLVPLPSGKRQGRRR
ncbi:hypothetical protein LY76DRAFT_606220 [Colletotrichum caudatum]|nr:hypothetical protein LY76DRAFT_606220 [Colletotrichum caudatum]